MRIVAAAFAVAAMALLADSAAEQDHATRLDDAAACRVAHKPEIYLGQTIEFVGDYQTDHIERSVITPRGCDRGIGVGLVNGHAQANLDAADRRLPPPQLIRANFVAKVVKVDPAGSQFYRDEGWRLNVSDVKLMAK